MQSIDSMHKSHRILLSFIHAEPLPMPKRKNKPSKFPPDCRARAVVQGIRSVKGMQDDYAVETPCLIVFCRKGKDVCGIYVQESGRVSKRRCVGYGTSNPGEEREA
jgi:hypothetical protein